MERQDHIEIPNNVLVHCPKVGYEMARVVGCASCEAFSGLEDRFPGSNHPFQLRYRLKCSHEPVRRDMVAFREGGA